MAEDQTDVFGNTSGDIVGQETGRESSLSSYVGPYVTEMLGRGQALATEPYQAYMGPLTAGQSELETQAFEGLASLDLPKLYESFPYAGVTAADRRST